MRNTPSTLSITAIAFTLALTGCDTSGESKSDTTSETGQTTQELSEEYNDADVEYLSGMIPHHRQAYEMSEMMLSKDGIDPRVTALAEDIREAQGREIEQMESWLDAWGESDHVGEHEDMDHDEMDDGEIEDMGHEGMMSEEELADLEESTEVEASRMFLEQMIVHHEGAVSSAEQHLQEGENPEALDLSEDIIADQQAEIEQMEELLEDL
ncbi:DUF305 domain-containing protein [Nesterenkonia salmonea]|uniref:DUF305 domain-containing protein n=1 Tax=Nesterenkonia salmonea TaxID=1804987 RepID=A0A5R9B7P1_9MICC|nr:DUF305 domain-containing protein [Nesterenkonia salmonea]TLP93055.1 DUF305 domain-containing protein [Nesterenkonia salmonea]